MIAELQRQQASANARELRRDELQKHGRLLNVTTLSPSCTEEQYSFASIFTKHVGRAMSLRIKEPYLVSSYQLDNLRTLLDALITNTFVRDVALVTHVRSRAQETSLSAVMDHARALGMICNVSFEFVSTPVLICILFHFDVSSFIFCNYFFFLSILDALQLSLFIVDLLFFMLHCSVLCVSFVF